MMMQLNPPIPVDTPRGAAYAHLVIDYSQEHYVLFVCFLCESGECWVYPNRDVKLQANLSMGVRVPNSAHFSQPDARAGDGLVNRTANYPLHNGNGNGKHEVHH